MTKMIPILKVGRYKDSSGRNYDITPHMLKELEETYHPNSAPLVKGHPNHDEPALGWVDQLKAEGDVLLASFSQVAESFKNEVAEGLFKNVSASFFLPFSEANPTKGQYSLRHVGALGASRPAIPGLGTLQEALAFAEQDDGLVCFSSSNQEDIEEDNMHHNNHNGKEEIMEEEIAVLQERIKRLEEENRRLISEREAQENKEQLESAIAKVQETKTLDEEGAKNLREKAMELVQLGKTPEEAVAAFAEFLPNAEPQRTNSRIAQAPVQQRHQGLAQFSEGNIPWEHTEQFADEVEKLCKGGLSRMEAYQKAKQNLSK
ncbi:hypothetical protein SAMN02745150_01184 [Brevinema andersonii]|uniref:Mu-like prophage I protein n=1 Tax=Brevinema andersonii TaxID=34097 RepID=A0A1I1EMV1_BREAD|nr:hypothetical protein [Brevinema andersonii]SFB88434.1 hypothetical protein SAMN02745150_01184 [Brevinema andersonii]